MSGHTNFFKLTSKNGYFWHICDNCSNSLKDSSQTKGQKNIREVILESPNLTLINKIKIFILDIHRTSCDHSKVWSKMDKFDLSGIATQN